MKKIVVLISGSGSNLEAILESCAAKKINGKVIHVISNNPDAFGLIRASKFNIASKIIDHKKFSSRADFENSLEDFLDKLNPDLIVLAGFMRILGTNITSKFSNKMINLKRINPPCNNNQIMIGNNNNKISSKSSTIINIFR